MESLQGRGQISGEGGRGTWIPAKGALPFWEGAQTRSHLCGRERDRLPAQLALE